MKSFHNLIDSDNLSNHRKSSSKESLSNTTIRIFLQIMNSIYREKMEQMLLAYGLPKETVIAIMMLYKNTKAIVRSPDGDTDFFDIEPGVLQRDTCALYLFKIHSLGLL